MIDKFKEMVSFVKSKVDSLIDSNRVVSEIPSEGKDAVGDFVEALAKESDRFISKHFIETAKLRMNQGNVDKFYENCLNLESGNHWEVWGRRNTSAGDEWKQERIDNEIGNQIRVRNVHLTSNWHDILVSPNIQHISEIINQEREKNDWGNFIQKITKSAQVFGEGNGMIYIDYETNPQGVVRPVFVEPRQLKRTPYSSSFRLSDGCWYVIHASMVNDKYVNKEFPNVDLSDLKSAGRDFISSVTRKLNEYDKSYDHTRIYPRYICFLDCPELEKIEYPEEEQGKIVEENKSILDGLPVKANENDDHVSHLRSHIEAMDNAVSLEPETDEELAMQLTISEAIMEHIQEHIDLATEDEVPVGYKKKYPYGRMIVTIGGKVVKDIPNPYQIDWRKLFVTLKNEDVLGRIDGRGDVENLWNDNKTIDTMLSRVDDMSLSVSFPKKYRHISDKKIVLTDGESNDPLRTEYYTQTPPVFRQGIVPNEPFSIYRIINEKIQNRLGVTEIAYGKAPTADSSAKLVDTLASFSQVLIAGELNQNLNQMVKDVIETFLELYKKFYTEPRQYFINGKLQKINVSEILTKQEIVNENGQVEVQEIEKFEVYVKPYSNFANRWESDLVFFFSLMDKRRPDGSPLIPIDAVYDLLSERYPAFGKNGEYRKKLEEESARLLMQQQMMEMMKQIPQKQNNIESIGKNFIKEKISRPTNGSNVNNQNIQQNNEVSNG
jgi:hypothetical protein